MFISKLSHGLYIFSSYYMTHTMYITGGGLVTEIGGRVATEIDATIMMAKLRNKLDSINVPFYYKYQYIIIRYKLIVTNCAAP